MKEALVALLTACLLGAAQLLREHLDSKRRSSGQLRTRRDDADPADPDRAQVWLLDDRGGRHPPANGHGDPHP